MKSFYILLCAALLTTLYACRQDDDYVFSTAGNDNIVGNFSGSNFSNQFKALWTAINTNYVAWDIETVNWDDVRTKYEPRFAELDTLIAREETVSDEMFERLYHEVLDTLHDGHSMYLLKNLSTGNYLQFSPQTVRNQRRFGEKMNVVVPYDISYYCSENIPAEERFVMGKTTNGSCKEVIKNNVLRGIANLERALERALTEEEAEMLMAQKERLENALTIIPQVPLEQEDGLISEYNRTASEIHDARMPQYQTNIPAKQRLQLMSALTHDGIAYLRLSSFQLTPYLTATEEQIDAMAEQGLTDDAALYKQVQDTWALWYEGIQEFSASGKLKGVILDVRNNTGGMNSDQAFLLGSLLPSGGYRLGTYKSKTGIGRLDYSVNHTFEIATREDEHAVITQVPIVALCNHRSISNAEMTSIAVKQLPNGVVVGSQTWGGMSSLITGAENYSINYSGEFGVQGVTAIYGFQPISLISYDGYGPLEGVGVTPSEGYNLEYDTDYRSSSINPATGQPYIRDNQLEAALKCIRGN